MKENNWISLPFNIADGSHRMKDIDQVFIELFQMMLSILCEIRQYEDDAIGDTASQLP